MCVFSTDEIIKLSKKGRGRGGARGGGGARGRGVGRGRGGHQPNKVGGAQVS